MGKKCQKHNLICPVLMILDMIVDINNIIHSVLLPQQINVMILLGTKQSISQKKCKKTL